MAKRYMKLHRLFIILIMVISVAACASSSSRVPGTTPAGPGDELFLQAEKMFAAESYDEALALYEEYLFEFPSDPMVAAALIKIGIIYSLQKDYDKARAAFLRVASDYPDSAFALDAKFELLFTLYQEGRNADVIAQARQMLQGLESDGHRFRVYALMGDAHLSMGSTLEAIDYYVRAQQIASESEQEAIFGKIKEAIARLDSSDVEALINRDDLQLPVDFLFFQLGLNYAMEEAYDDALLILDEFMKRYPDHENIILVESLIEEIKKNAIYNHTTVGCLLPLSGPYQTFGNRALKGIELALDQFISRNPDSNINIIVKDTGGDPDKTMAALQELAQAQVAAIVGPIVTVELAAQEAQKMGIPIMTITQKDNIVEIGDKVFRNFITPKMQVDTLTSYAVDVLGLTRFAVLYPDENYGVTFMNLFWDQLIDKGGTIVGVEAYDPKHTDFTDPIKKLVGLFYKIPEDLKVADEEPESEQSSAASGGSQGTADDAEADKNEQEEEEPQSIVDFEAIFIPDSPKQAGLIIPQLAYHDVKDVTLLGTNLWHSKTLIKMADQYVQGAIMTDGFFAESPISTVRNFVNNFEETYLEKPEFIEAVVYDSAMILFHVVSQPHIRFRTEIRDALLNPAGFSGVTGNTRFDENGDAVKKLYLLKIKRKSFVELEYY